MSYDSWLAEPYEDQPDDYRCPTCLRYEGDEHEPGCAEDEFGDEFHASMVERPEPCTPD